MKAIIIGAGLAGLTAGYRLQKQGWDVSVLEAAAEIGGRTKSLHIDGYQIEKGATQLSSGYTDYLALANEIGLGDAIADCSNIVILMREGRLYEVDGARPLTALFSGALTLPSKLKMLTAIRDYMAVAKSFEVSDVSQAWAADTESAEAYCERRLNKEIYDVLVDPLIRTYTINRGANVSVLEWYSGLKNLAGNKMLALTGGINRLPQALAEKLHVQTSTKAMGVSSIAGGVEVDIEANGVRDTLVADACVVATRAFEAQEIAPHTAEAFNPLLQKLHYNRAAVVHLGFSAQLKTKALGVLPSTVEHPQIGLVWLESNKLAETAPDGHSLVSCFFEEGGFDTVSPASDENFISIAETFTTKLFPELTGARDMANVVRWNNAIPNPAPGAYRAVHEFKEKLDDASPIQFAGDYMTCTGQNSAIYWGRRAAENIATHIGRRNAPVGE